MTPLFYKIEVARLDRCLSAERKRYLAESKHISNEPLNRALRAKLSYLDYALEEAEQNLLIAEAQVKMEEAKKGKIRWFNLYQAACYEGVEITKK